MKVIEDCRIYGLDIIVVDDGSTDNTADAIQPLNNDNKPRVILLNIQLNKGMDRFLKTGFDFAVANNYKGV